MAINIGTGGTWTDYLYPPITLQDILKFMSPPALVKVDTSVDEDKPIYDEDDEEEEESYSSKIARYKQDYDIEVRSGGYVTVNDRIMEGSTEQFIQHLVAMLKFASEYLSYDTSAEDEWIEDLRNIDPNL